MKSRLTRRAEKQTKNQFFLSITGIVILLFVLYQLGPFLLTNTGIIMDTIFSKNKGDINYLKNAPYQTPTLNPLPIATPSSTLIVSGKTIYNGGLVEIYVNDNLLKEAEVSSNGNFEEEIKLSNGNNTIKARFVKSDKQSAFTDVYNVSYLTNAPSLDIEFPQDGQTFSKGDQNIIITGKTNPDSTVSVNSRIAIVASDGSFSYNLGLSEGENKINIEALNQAGEQTSKTITVSYKP